MKEIKLIKPSDEYAEKIEEYRAEFPDERERVTNNPSRIPGMDYLNRAPSNTEEDKLFSLSVTKVVVLYLV